MSNTLYGIDVSTFQGKIDWDKIKSNGLVEFAILRAGYGQGNVDDRFYYNASECTRLDIPFGVYWFSYAYTIPMAEREAQYCIKTVSPYNLTWPIFYDFEDDSVRYAANNGVTMNAGKASAMALTFINTVREAGYIAGNYSNPNFINLYFTADELKLYPFWQAQYASARSKLDGYSPVMWQYTSNGIVPGVNGRCDLNYGYFDYRTAKKEEDVSEDKIREIVKDEIANYISDKAKLDGSDWSKEDREWAIENGIFKGDGSGNFMWQSPITREQTAAVLKRLKESKTI